MKDEVVIVGYDCMSPLGTDVAQTWNGVVNNRSGIRPIDRYDPRENFLGPSDVVYGGQIPLTYRELAGSDLKYEKFPEPSHHAVPLVCRRVFDAIDFSIDHHNPQRIALLSATAYNAQISQHELESTRKPYVNFMLNQCHNVPMAIVAKEFGLQGPSMSIISACASGNHAVFTACCFIKAGLVDAAIVAAFEFPIFPVSLGGFDWLNALYRRDKVDDRAYEDPSQACRPFSPDRRGFLPAEGVGAVFLSRADYAQKMHWPLKGVIVGGNVNSDGGHLTRINAENAATCIRGAMADAGCGVDAIDCINAHATSTPKGDAAEMQALHEVFGERLKDIPVVANKSQLGHSLGACSILELIVALEGMNAAVVAPTLNYLRDPLLPEAFVHPHAIERPHKCTLLNSFGFGGTNTSLVVGLA